MKKIHSKISIGLALGSGAAKGWAHIGVLKGLANEGIYPDKVAGCSVGALVGAAYANDSLAELEEWVRGFSSWDILRLMDLSWRKGGLLGGDKIFDVIQRRFGNLDIQDLSIPFTAIAADLYSGQEIWFNRGNLRQAVRASCSMPGLLSPVKQGERWLIDGAVVNPVPVSVARSMGVDIVIAVDLNCDRKKIIKTLPVNVSSDNSMQMVTTDPHKETKFMDLLAKGRDYISHLSKTFGLNNNDPSMLAVMSQSMDILQQRHKRARLMGDPPDVLITPQVGDIGSMEFHRADEAISIGQEAVELNIEQIMRVF